MFLRTFRSGALYTTFVHPFTLGLVQRMLFTSYSFLFFVSSVQPLHQNLPPHALKFFIFFGSKHSLVKTLWRPPASSFFDRMSCGNNGNTALQLSCACSGHQRASAESTFSIIACPGKLIGAESYSGARIAWRVWEYFPALDEQYVFSGFLDLNKFKTCRGRRHERNQ